MFKSTRRTWLPALLCLVALGLLLSPGAVTEAAGQNDEVVEVYVLGRPATTFSPKPARTLEELQTQFESYADEIKKILEMAEWPGDPEDLLRTVREGGDAVSQRAVPSQHELEWMVFRRRNKEPRLAHNVRWSAKKPFDAWNVLVESNGYEYTFVIPMACLNLAMDKVPPRKIEPPPEPECTLTAKATDRCDIAVAATVQDAKGVKITDVEGGSLNRLKPARGPLRWSYTADKDGKFRFVGTTTGGESSATCTSDWVTLDNCTERPVCSLSASVDTETGLIALSTDGSTGEVADVKVTLPDGSTETVSGSSFDPSDSLPRRPGDYTYTFGTSSQLNGFTAECDDASVVVTRPPTKWIARGFFARIDGDDQQMTSATRPDGTSERTKTALESGDGFGASIERLFSPRVGLEAGVLLADLDSKFTLDLNDAWATDNEDIGLTAFTLGLNFHLTPDSAVDLYLGPLIALVNYDSATYNTLGERFRRSYDDEFAVGAQIGLDIPFGKDNPWAFATSLKYLALGAEDDGAGVDLDLDPLILTAGVAYRF